MPQYFHYLRKLNPVTLKHFVNRSRLFHDIKKCARTHTYTQSFHGTHNSHLTFGTLCVCMRCLKTNLAVLSISTITLLKITDTYFYNIYSAYSACCITNHDSLDYVNFYLKRGWLHQQMIEELQRLVMWQTGKLPWMQCCICELFMKFWCVMSVAYQSYIS